MFNELLFLNNNKTVVFNSPIEGDDCLVRIGNKNSSFLHAFLNAYSLKYTSMDDKEKIDFGKYIETKLTKKLVNDFQNNTKDFKDNCEKILSYFYNITNNEINFNNEYKLINKFFENVEMKNVYKLIFEIVSIESLKKVFSDSLKSDIVNEINNLLETTEVLKIIDTKKSEYIKQILNKIVNNIIEQSEHINTKNNLKQFDLISLNPFSLNFVSNYFDRNIYFIHPKTRLPYKKFEYEYLEDRKSILLLSYEDNKYENVGKLLIKNAIQREFNSDDIIIEETKKIFRVLNRSPDRKTKTPISSPKRTPVVNSDKTPTKSPKRTPVVKHDVTPATSPEKTPDVKHDITPETSPEKTLDENFSEHSSCKSVDSEKIKKSLIHSDEEENSDSDTSLSSDDSTIQNSDSDLSDDSD